MAMRHPRRLRGVMAAHPTTNAARWGSPCKARKPALTADRGATGPGPAPDGGSTGARRLRDDPPMRFLALALALGVALTGLAPSPAAAQTPPLPGDKLSYETVLALGFESLPRAVRDPCAVEMRVDLGVAAVDAKGMDVDVEISVGVRAVRYSGPTFSWALEPATPEGFITRGPTPQEGEDIENAPLSRDLPPLAQE